MIRFTKMAAVAAAALAASATMGFTQEQDPELTGYQYTWYYDEAKTQYGGEVYDRGCGGWGENRYVLRSFVPSGYYDTTPIFYCGGGVIGPIE